ncbi:MAG: hypothetical protein Q7S27_06145 [Nanoarchaeota archaeon]|nr:hypothetical protein [Nanoarchaeota archaeon]
MKKRDLLVFAVIVISLIVIRVEATTPALITSPYLYSFNTNGVLYEASSDSLTSSPYWWLNSGAKLNLSNGRGKTIQKELSATDKWRLIYLASNPVDTDNGYHPQNIFRLLSRSKWQNFQQMSYFKINRDQLSKSPNRDEHNGLLLMSRYQNSNNLYYAGIRVDGTAIIKKKLNGQYYTLASKKIFTGTYNRASSPNLLPKNVWLGLKSQVTNLNGKVNIKLYLDKGWTGTWALVLDVTDGSLSSKSPLLNEGYAGIRTDFMDVEFDNYRLIKV